MEGTLEQLLEAGAAGGALSFADWMCLVLARDRGWTCVTNDNRLRRGCTDAGVGVLWGLQLMVKLVEAGEMGATDAVDVAEAIRETNPWLSKQVVARFREQVHSPCLSVGRTLTAPVGRPKTSVRTPKPERGAARWRRWARLVEGGLSRAEVARSESVSRAAVTLGLQKLERRREDGGDDGQKV